jgi:uncharacterized protein YnzC (UPF0291/DUF896 family)
LIEIDSPGKSGQKNIPNPQYERKLPMDMKQLVARLNEIYKESKSRSLSTEELAERDQLRKEYLSAIKDQVRHSLDHVEVVDEDGKIIEHHKH